LSETLTWGAVEMSDTLHVQDVHLAFCCQRGSSATTNSSGTTRCVCLRGGRGARAKAYIVYFLEVWYRIFFRWREDRELCQSCCMVIFWSWN